MVKSTIANQDEKKLTFGDLKRGDLFFLHASGSNDLYMRLDPRDTDTAVVLWCENARIVGSVVPFNNKLLVTKAPTTVTLAND